MLYSIARNGKLTHFYTIPRSIEDQCPISYGISNTILLNLCGGYQETVALWTSALRDIVKYWKRCQICISAQFSCYGVEFCFKIPVMTLFVILFQTRPVPFVVHAIVTNSDLQFNTTEIDFGHCTIYESVRTTIQLTNKSILPQEFGFMGLPEVCCTDYHLKSTVICWFLLDRIACSGHFLI